MKILYGMYHANSGAILIDGKECNITSPKDAMKYGIAMIQQHFALVSAHTVAENIILGNCKGKLNLKQKNDEIQKLIDKYHFDMKATDYIKNLPVGTQQKVEILKALYLNTRILIMDEPTAVLTPQEVEILMQFVKEYVAKGNTVVFITHKMKEVMEVSDRIIVMRNGAVCGNVKKSETDEKTLSRMMIGHELENIHSLNRMVGSKRQRLQIENVTVENEEKLIALDHISFTLQEGEIIGIAGVSGNGQQELCEAICGNTKIKEGSIILDKEDITHAKIKTKIDKGIGYVPSDRLRFGMVSDMSLSENMLLKSSFAEKWAKHGIISWKKLNAYTEEMIKQYAVKAPDYGILAGSLSGGNQQKVVVAREIGIGEKLIVFDQPTRGLDIGAINYVHKTILAEKEKGKSIILVSTELSEIFALSDKIAVLYRGKLMGIYKKEELTIEKIGLLMAGYKTKEAIA